MGHMSSNPIAHTRAVQESARRLSHLEIVPPALKHHLPQESSNLRGSAAECIATALLAAPRGGSNPTPAFRLRVWWSSSPQAEEQRTCRPGYAARTGVRSTPVAGTIRQAVVSAHRGGSGRARIVRVRVRPEDVRQYGLSILCSLWLRHGSVVADSLLASSRRRERSCLDGAAAQQEQGR